MRNRARILILVLWCVAVSGCDAMRRHAPNVAFIHDHRNDYLEAEASPKLVVPEALERMAVSQRYALPEQNTPRVTTEMSVVPPDFGS